MPEVRRREESGENPVPHLTTFAPASTQFDGNARMIDVRAKLDAWTTLPEPSRHQRSEDDDPLRYFASVGAQAEVRRSPTTVGVVYAPKWGTEIPERVLQWSLQWSEGTFDLHLGTGITGRASPCPLKMSSGIVRLPFFRCAQAVADRCG